MPTDIHEQRREIHLELGPGGKSQHAGEELESFRDAFENDRLPIADHVVAAVIRGGTPYRPLERKRRDVPAGTAAIRRHEKSFAKREQSHTVRICFKVLYPIFRVPLRLHERINARILCRLSRFF